MDPNRLRMLVAPGFASLLLILLCLCAVDMRGTASQGFSIPMIRLQHDPNEPTDCGDRAEFLWLTKDGRTWANSEEIPAGQVQATVAALMANRVEKVVYVVVDSELSYGQFASFFDQVSGATPDLHVVLVSGEIRKAFEKNFDLCDFKYPRGWPRK